MAELADRGATWGSVLSVSAFTAIRSVGFEPVGQVFGAAGYPLTATAAVSCPGAATHSLIPGAGEGYGLARLGCADRAGTLRRVQDGDRPDDR